eukprot:CAMPEP_0198120408 /NCGR_PEP_ID=MMETSP1442-20131203/28954_1 /TAXON_ID= /ORGANISM="Craspedostauros australis, Strain CCMP3328" /LENGTH=168 /DNA_ID=CAMNT_0043779055 /DNA_START=108 /DNA_END=614 /DNA_ORIENTATION=-
MSATPGVDQTTQLLPAPLQNTVRQTIDRVNKAGGGIRVILLTTAEGVPLGRFYAPDQAASLPPDVLTNLEAMWAPPSKQLPLLNLGNETKAITAMYEHATIIHLHQSPVVVTIILQPGSNLGAVRSTGIPLLRQNLSPLCTTLLNSLAPAKDPQETATSPYPGQNYYQ